MTEQEQAIGELAQQHYEQEHIKAQILELQDKATAASRECIHYMSVDHQDNKKYLAALREHTEATKEINKLKSLLKEQK
ncbi:hypothetical protein SAMN05192529_102125 [Arachidicoccus rhizosphaerae]|uniref:Uncharacterized protein n=1 Tax=Arachidicoccus rhizosphaerae TaxID=551991 RepID=A0A1H3W6H0_9BACT|nr:hypothetical protein [Arachidicoccus rhizosphaerae]SDZ81962.1 hypothetical protein SAMN05192529_102125 [Arachidicoccus rhizosphaerae]